MNKLEKVADIYPDCPILVKDVLKNQNKNFQLNLINKYYKETGFFEENQYFSNIEELIEYHNKLGFTKAKVTPFNKFEKKLQYDVSEIHKVLSHPYYIHHRFNGMGIGFKIPLNEFITFEGFNEDLNYNHISAEYILPRGKDKDIFLNLISLSAIENFNPYKKTPIHKQAVFFPDNIRIKQERIRSSINY